MKHALLGLALASIVSGCAGTGAGTTDTRSLAPGVNDSKTSQPKKPGKYQAPTAEVVEATNDLVESLAGGGLDLLSDVAAANGGKNVMISPWSLNECMGMLRLGAKGQSETDLAALLSAKSSAEEAAKSAKSLRTTVTSLMDTDVLRQANGLWIKQGEAIEKPFLDACQSQFEASVKPTKFPEPGLGEVNQFVNSTTRGKIPKLFDSLDPLTVAVLVNAVSFKDLWAEPFKPEATRELPFKLADGKDVKTRMMSQSGDFQYGTNKEFAFAHLPYQSGLSMVLILPNKGVSLNSVLKNKSALLEALSGGVSKPGTIQIPKWKSEFNWNIKDFMIAKGWKSLFDPMTADLTGIQNGPDRLYITQALQKSFIEVDEKGTEAAAATGVAVGTTAAPAEPEEPFTLLCDHPFAYAIVDPLGVPYFIGVVSDPTK